MNVRLSEPAAYVVKAFCIAVCVYVVIQILPVEMVTSDMTARVLNLVGIPAQCYEQHGRVYLEYLQISIDCTALEVVAIFLGLIMAANAPVARKIGFAIFGAGAVFVANIVRISVVYYLLERDVPWYVAHDIFSGGLAIAAGMLFLVVSEHWMPHINENLYSLLDAAENLIRPKKR
jgi:exosortase/archaeosortase family protein